MRNSLRTIVLIVIGVGLGIGLFAAVRATNLKIGNISTPSTRGNSSIQTQTIIKEKSDVIDVVKKDGQSVVSIAIKRTATRNPFSQSPFGIFDPDMSPSQQNTNRESGIGTGFIVGENGVIVTNKHVVDAEGQYVVITNDNKKYDVQKINKDPLNDLAIIKINATGLKAMELGDSSALDVGQTVIAMGNALGEFKNTVTVGVVSGLDRQIEASDQVGGSPEKLGNVIQTDAAINPGNSGGPLLNIGGQVIGINTAVAAGGVAQNIGFAIPINSAKPIISEFFATGKISSPYIGVRYQMITKRMALLNEIPEGAYVAEVVAGGPAEKAGIKADDIITELARKKLNDTNQLTDVIRTLKVGQSVDIKYYREDKEVTARVTVGEAGQ
ncbi:MAG: trypsin-like peptidase domain-containing protein [bacterium]|nr:trypsin-like peptidase domain-containing protein [bacterium]